MVIAGRLDWLMQKVRAGHVVQCSHSYNMVNAKSKVTFRVQAKPLVVHRAHQIVMEGMITNLAAIMDPDIMVSTDRGHRKSNGISEASIWYWLSPHCVGAVGAGSSSADQDGGADVAGSSSADQGAGADVAGSSCAGAVVAGSTCADLGVGADQGAGSSGADVAGSSCADQGNCSDVASSSCADQGEGGDGGSSVHAAVSTRMDPWNAGTDPWTYSFSHMQAHGSRVAPEAFASHAVSTCNNVAAANSKRAIDVISRARTKKVRIDEKAVVTPQLLVEL